MAAVPLPRLAKMVAMMNSGASEASGASHCTSRNRSMPSSVPAATRLSANGSAHSRITTPDIVNRPTTAIRRLRFGQVPEGGGGADQVGLFDVAVAELVEVEAEPGQQRQPQHQVDVAGRGDDERGHTGDQQEPEFHPIGGFQRQTSGFAGSRVCAPRQCRPAPRPASPGPSTAGWTRSCWPRRTACIPGSGQTRTRSTGRRRIRAAPRSLRAPRSRGHRRRRSARLRRPTPAGSWPTTTAAP